MPSLSTLTPFSYIRPNAVNININVGPQFPSNYPASPAFNPFGYDSMFNPMSSMGMGFSSPIMFLMNMMNQLMQMMMMSGQQQMPPFNPGPSPLPNPGDFWGTSNGSGYQDYYPEGSNSQIFGNDYSQNVQNTWGGTGLQRIDSGYGSSNIQNHSFGRAKQSIFTGSGTYNSQTGGWHAQQTLGSGNHSINQQTGGYNSSQALITGNGSTSAQVSSGGALSQQSLKSGNGAANLQVGAADQFTRTGNGSSTVQVGGQVQEVKGGKNNVVSQVSDPSNNATQKATVDAGSTVNQAGGLTQQANLNGPNSTANQQGTGGTLSQVNVKDARGAHMTYETNGTRGNTWEINYGDQAQSMKTTLTSEMDGNTTVRNLGGGDDRQTVEFKDPRHTGDVILNGEGGNDTFVFQNMPADPKAKYVINGGTGDNTLQMPGGNFTLLNPDGSVLRQFGEGGPAITVSDVQTVRVPGENGAYTSYNLAPEQACHR